MRTHLLALLLLLTAGVAARVALYTEGPVLWDAAVYIQMGQFLWSGGEIGLWEGLRPPVWPALLGAIWKLGLPVASSAQVMSAFFSLASVPLLWDFTRRVAGTRAAWFAAVLWSFSPILFYWGNFRFTGIPALFWMLLGFWQMQRSRWLAAGLCLSLASLTRFPVVLAFVAALPALVHGADRRRQLRFSAGALLPVGVYAAALAANGTNLFETLFTGTNAIAGQARRFEHGRFYFTAFLWRHESYLLALAPVGWWLLLRRRGPAVAAALATSGFLFLVFFSLLRVQFVRYLLPALPGLYFATALTLGWASERATPRWRGAVTTILILLSVAVQIPAYARLRFPQAQQDVFQSYIGQFREQLDGQRIWISSPTMLFGSNLRANRLLYYPVVNQASLLDAMGSLDQADVVLIARDHMPCSPPGDPDCLRLRRELFASLRRDFIAEWEEPDEKGEVEAGIYRRVSH